MWGFRGKNLLCLQGTHFTESIQANNRSEFSDKIYYYNVKEKQKHHQSRLPVSAWHYTKIMCENNSHNRQMHSQLVRRSSRHIVNLPQRRYTRQSTRHTILGDFRVWRVDHVTSWLAPVVHMVVR